MTRRALVNSGGDWAVGRQEAGVGGLDRGSVGQPKAKAIVHRLLVFVLGVKVEAVAGAGSVGDDVGGTGGK